MEERTEFDKDGFSIKPTISDEECIRICLSNTPCGIDKKQVARILEEMGTDAKVYQKPYIKSEYNL